MSQTLCNLQLSNIFLICTSTFNFIWRVFPQIFTANIHHQAVENFVDPYRIEIRDDVTILTICHFVKIPLTNPDHFETSFLSAKLSEIQAFSLNPRYLFLHFVRINHPLTEQYSHPRSIALES